MRTVCSAGGLIVKDDCVLLVKIAYGANKDCWMLPGGLVDEGESPEQAAVREVREEAGVQALPLRLIGVRTGIKETEEGPELGVHLVYEMAWVSGEAAPDRRESADARFRPIHEALEDADTIPLTKELLRAYLQAEPGAGLSRTDNEIATNNKYVDYAVYTV